MRTIKQLLEGKAPQIWSVEPGSSVYDAMKLMSEKDVGALLVMNGDKLSGLFSERDYARKVILMDRSSRDTRVEEIMTRKVYTTHPDDTVQHCMGVMTSNRFRHLPVVDNNEKILGMVSIGDLVKSVIDEQQFQIEQLEQYINS
ncbi:MAG: CBS domain-containing protein [Gammaproteobacteria bacterium]|nr:CBS domain-containing protein [Gammaproteobacteria bacterium]